jgi:hypothetical protein
LLCLVALLAALWAAVDANGPSKPVAAKVIVDGKGLTNSSSLLAEGLRAVQAAQAADGAQAAEHYTGDDPDMCFFVRLPKQTVLFHYLACGGVFREYGGTGPTAIWFVPFRVTGTAARAIGTVSGRAQFASLGFGTKLWRPDGHDGTIVNDGFGNMESDFSYSPPGTTLAPGEVALVLAFWADVAAIAVVVAIIARGLWLGRRAAKASTHAAKAWEIWDPVTALAFAPAISPPTPVLVAARPRPAAVTTPSLPEPPGAEVDEDLEAEQEGAEGPVDPAPPAGIAPAGTTPSIAVMGPVVHSGASSGSRPPSTSAASSSRPKPRKSARRRHEATSTERSTSWSLGARVR